MTPASAARRIVAPCPSGSKTIMSLRDAAALGGWKDTKTLLTVYMVPDDISMRSGLAELEQRREAAKRAESRLNRQHERTAMTSVPRFVVT